MKPFKLDQSSLGIQALAITTACVVGKQERLESSCLFPKLAETKPQPAAAQGRQRNKSGSTLLRVIPTVAFQVIYSNILCDIDSDSLSGISYFFLVYILAFYLAYILAFYVAFYLACILSFYVAFFLAYMLAFYVAYILVVFLAHILAFHLATEVQRCRLSSEGPRLRSSGAHWARKVPG